jgi:hypothetical protein
MKKFAHGLRRLHRKRPESSTGVPDSSCTIEPEATTLDPIGAQTPSSQTDVIAIPQSTLSNAGVEQEGRNVLPIEHQQGHLILFDANSPSRWSIGE